MIAFKRVSPRVDLGYIPMFLSEANPKSAKEQINDGYQHGGGWHPLDGFTMNPDGTLQYGNASDEDADPPLRMLAEGRVRDEVVRFYEHDWVVIIQPDGSFEAARID